jgi:hypothetical protein
MRSSLTAGQRERFEAVGLMASVWALAEIFLDLIVAETFNKWGDACPEPDPPRSLKRKLKFLRSYIAAHDMDFKDTETLRNVRTTINRMIDEATQTGEDRHWMVHGCGGFGTYDLTRFLKSKHGGSAERVTKTYTIAEIDALSARALMFVQHLVAFGYAGLQVISHDDFNKLLPDIASKLVAAFPDSQLARNKIAKIARDS